MGAIQQSTPDMGPFHIEVRRESLYLMAPSEVLRVASRSAWGVPDAAARQAVAALDLAMNHLAFVEYVANHGPFSTAPTATPQSGEIWFEWTGDQAYAGSPEANGHDHALVELAYRDTPAVRWILNALSDAPSPVEHWVDDPQVPLAEHRPVFRETGSAVSGSCSCHRWVTSASSDRPSVAQAWLGHLSGVRSRR